MALPFPLRGLYLHINKFLHVYVTRLQLNEVNIQIVAKHIGHTSHAIHKGLYLTLSYLFNNHIGGTI